MKKGISFAIVSTIFIAFCSHIFADVGYVPSAHLISAAAGVIDMHVHPAPDVFGRSLTDNELAQLAIHKGLRGFVLKNHVAPTADRATLVMQQHPGIEVWGGVVLNKSVGGINPEAVRRMYTMSGGRGKVVWLPTLDAAAAIERIDGKQDGSGLRIVANGKVIPEMDEILKIIAANNLVLATGHVSADEVVAVVKRAKELGVKNILVNHAFTTVPHLTLAQAETVANMGAMIEICYVQFFTGANSPFEWMTHWERVDAKTTAHAVKVLGANHIVLSTDLGQQGLMTPLDGIENEFRELKAAGVSQADLDIMTKANPSKLLSLKTGAL